MNHMFVLCFLLMVKQTIAISSAHSSYLLERFAYYSKVIKNTSEYATNTYSHNAYTSCQYYDVCNFDEDSIEWTNSSAVFPGGIYVNTSYVGHKLVGGAVVANEINEICFATNSQRQWRDGLEADAYGAMAWQYLGSASEGTYSYFPLANWSSPNKCPGDYDPRERAWYRSAISGPVNTVIMIDVSSAESYDATLRLTRQVEAGILLLNSLNYWSFFNVGIYTDDATFFAGSGTMLRATTSNKASAIAYMNALTLDNSIYVSLENTIKSTLAMVQAAERAGTTTYCHSIVAFLATDHNDLASSSSVSQAVNSYSSESALVILSFVFNFQNYIVDPVYEEMTCLTDGFQQVLTSSTHDESSLIVLQKYSAYLAATLENTDIRYSEIYEDVLGMGDLTTGTTPLYSNITDSNGNTVRSVIGVYGIDLVIANMNDNGAISNADMMSSLAKISTCPALSVSDETLAFFRDSASCTVPLDTINYGEGGEFAMEENKWKYDLLGSFGLVITLGITVAVLFRINKAKDFKGVSVYHVAIIVLQVAFGIALVCYTLSTSWDDMIFNKYWKSSNMTILSTTIDPQICCNVINCRCANYYGTSCTAMKDSYQEGYCDAGYYCCQYTTETCNCDREGNCQTCTYCVSSVNHQQCEVECMECYVGKVTWYYEPEETTNDVVREYKKMCDEGNEARSLQCAQSYIGAYPVGSIHDISYNPLNLLETSTKSTDLPGNYYTVIISLTICFLVSYCFFIPLLSLDPNKGSSQQVMPVTPVSKPSQPTTQVIVQQAPGQVQITAQQQPQPPQSQPMYAQQQPMQPGQLPVQQQQPMFAQQQPMQPQMQQPMYVQQQPMQQQPMYAQQQPMQQPMMQPMQQPMYAQQQPMYAQQQPMYAQQQPMQSMQQPMYAQQQAMQQQPMYSQVPTQPGQSY